MYHLSYLRNLKQELRQVIEGPFSAYEIHIISNFLTSIVLNYFKSYLVPLKADKESILARHENGMLYIKFTKKEEEKSKKIVVN